MASIALPVLVMRFPSTRGSERRSRSVGRLWSGSSSGSSGLHSVRQQERSLGLRSSTSSSRLRVGSGALSVPPIHCCCGRGSGLPALEPLPVAKEGERRRTPLNNNGPRSEHGTPEQCVWKARQRTIIGVVLASVALAWACVPVAAHALAENSIGASSLGLRVAEFLRRSGLSDELVVVIVGMLPVLELRGAIPVSYWLKIEPVKGYLLSVLGNMIPVPFIVLYLEKILKTVGEKGETGQNFVRWIVDRTRKQAGPIEEFEWLGLMLFVAIPLPGTGAWSGAIAASILGMPFWDAVTANLWGVLVAGLLVTLIVTVGTKEAVLVGIALFLTSGLLWSLLRLIQKKKGPSSS